MNKSIALLIIGVISLAMFLIMINQVATTNTPPLVGVQNPLPQTSVPSSTALNPPTVPAPTPAPAAPVQRSTPATSTASSMLSTVKPPSTSSALPSPTQSLSPSAPEPAHVSRPAPERSVASPSPSVKPAPPVSVKEKTAPAPAPAPTPPPKAAGPKTISKITVSASGDGATVRIAGTAELAYKTMHLKSPDRLVVDLEGVWAVKAPGVPVNKAITNVRIGKQKDKTRIVIDLGRTPGGVNFVKVDKDTLEIRVK